MKCDRSNLHKLWHSSISFVITVLLTTNTSGQEHLTPEQNRLFEKYARPLLVKHCLECHAAEPGEGGLNLTSLADLRRGGDSGPAIVAGNADDSLIIQALRYESIQMPPSGSLRPGEIEGLAQWIQAGAPWPDGEKLRPTPELPADAHNWWAFRPITDPRIPTVVHSTWCRNSIDRFVLHRLEQERIEAAAVATPLRLFRRACFDLTGLPPSSKVVQTAAKLTSSHETQRVYTKLVDQLLASPAYGEHQARTWLDLVRYADSDGYRADHDRPAAKQYRDYVIRSFNQDKPYHLFITQQLAGDEVSPGDREALVATMFLRHWIYEYNQRDVETQWHEILSDITETTADVFLALGMKCARCHDHKFDPILQRDYYRMKAFFAALQPREDMPIADIPTRRAYQLELHKWEVATNEIRRQLHEIESPVLLKHSTKEGFEKFVPEIKAMVRKREANRSPYERQIAALATRQFEIHPNKLPTWLDEKTESTRVALRKQLANFQTLKPAPLPTQSFVVSDVGPVAPATLIPDDPTQEIIQPGVLTLFNPQPTVITPPAAALNATGRRTALANWIANPENPLTSRVIVNRIWQHHFGRGLVETSSDFGRLGSSPSHPKLLDWLARQFVADGWSLKRLHRQIVLSATYQQSALRPTTARLSRIDPENRLLWRMNSRRLNGEEIRDAMLVASGELVDKRRSIYLPVKRNQPNPLLALFDAPDRIRSADKRHTTTTSRQALWMTNGEWIQHRAAATTTRLHTEDATNFVDKVYRSLLGRPPGTQEQSQACQFLAGYPRPPNSTPRQAQTALVYALLNANEMIYVD